MSVVLDCCCPCWLPVLPHLPMFISLDFLQSCFAGYTVFQHTFYILFQLSNCSSSSFTFPVSKLLNFGATAKPDSSVECTSPSSVPQSTLAEHLCFQTLHCRLELLRLGPHLCQHFHQLLNCIEHSPGFLMCRERPSLHSLSLNCLHSGLMPCRLCTLSCSHLCQLVIFSARPSLD